MRLFLLASLLLSLACAGESTVVTVYKTPTCGCCTQWEAHLEDAGFEVESRVVRDVTPVKLENGLPHQLASCHTAFVDGYLVEGHVPASDVQRLLKERPSIAGLAVPGMPVGSPGMEGPNPVSYDVLAFDANGGVQVYSTHRP